MLGRGCRPVLCGVPAERAEQSQRPGQELSQHSWRSPGMIAWCVVAADFHQMPFGPPSVKATVKMVVARSAPARFEFGEML